MRHWLIAAAALHAAAALAYPEGAPWGAANPSAAETCASCHFGYDAVSDSPRINIEGLPATAVPGESYPLLIRVDLPDAVTVGFQMIAVGDDDAGAFTAEAMHVEYAAAAIRSTSPAAIDDETKWPLLWTAPATKKPVRFFLAVMASNDDGSPFGDTPHFRTFDVAM